MITHGTSILVTYLLTYFVSSGGKQRAAYVQTRRARAYGATCHDLLRLRGVREGGEP